MTEIFPVWMLDVFRTFSILKIGAVRPQSKTITLTNFPIISGCRFQINSEHDFRVRFGDYSQIRIVVLSCGRLDDIAIILSKLGKTREEMNLHDLGYNFRVKRNCIQISEYIHKAFYRPLSVSGYLPGESFRKAFEQP